MWTTFINDYLKLLFIMTPFFVLSSFIALTNELSSQEVRRTAAKVTIAVLISCFCVFFFGKYIFALFGITLDAFRIGAGTVLFLSGITMVNGRPTVDSTPETNDISVVPLALPITVGPGVIGVLMVMGAEPKSHLELLQFCAALAGAALSIGLILLSSGRLQRFLSKQSLAILQKMTGLFVTAIAAQIVFTGIRGFLL
ncbi:MAG: MarC family protein [Deltaproteobacteria bacterium]|nr:MarC family protein [Deltaproteobacteria bacterium]